ncbi:50S ribosomal protein L25/general stress protein Ctc [Bacillus pumilus]|uniref:50S ribosomal protein L25/general stress protein Ctc n=1 Tax=Bacillus pumilus TaxID=1408 RepID=UPI002238B4AA|nr:50S ribosomal protein L25/general stress protein Ctc [Bacillus pumilus]MCW4683255.1 50S ribosomal protein L25/general stress protein Ctc [Bacillus pumilus]
MATLKANKRTDFKRSTLQKIRHSGHVPGVIYGKNTESMAVSLDSIDLLKTLRDEGKNTIITLDVNGETKSVMVTELQTDPLKNELVHADFQVVDLQREIEADVPVQLIGESKGVKDGGVLQQPLFELSITAKPKDIPQHIEADITNLEVNDVLTVADLSVQSSYQVNNDPEEVVASILPPQQSEVPDSAEEPKEPEAIKEKDNDGE